MKLLVKMSGYLCLALLLISQCQGYSEYGYDPSPNYYYQQNASKLDNYFDHNYNVYPGEDDAYRTIKPITNEVTAEIGPLEYDLTSFHVPESELPPWYANSYPGSVPTSTPTTQQYQQDHNQNIYYYPRQNEKAEDHKHYYEYYPAPPSPTIETVEPATKGDTAYDQPHSRLPEIVYIPVKEKSFRKTYYRPQKIRPPPFEFPSSPLPGWSGIYSPNPGYLVRQKFQIYRPPAYLPPRQKSLASIWHKAIG